VDAESSIAGELRVELFRSVFVRWISVVRGGIPVTVVTELQMFFAG